MSRNPVSSFPAIGARALSWASLLRSGLGLVLLLQSVGVWLNLRDIIGVEAIVPSSLAELVQPRWHPRVGWFATILAHTGLEGQRVYIFCFALYTILLILLVLNFRPKLTSILVFALHSVILGSSGFSIYGADLLANVGLFYCVLAPAGAPEDSNAIWRSSLLQRLLQFQLVVVYITSGLAKAIGPQWWNGGAVWLALGMPVLRGMVDARPLLAAFPALATVAGVSVLILEIGYPLFMLPKVTRPVWLSLIIALHLGIALFLNLWSFALLMILLNICAFGDQYVARLAGRLSRRARSLREHQTISQGEVDYEEHLPQTVVR